MRLVYLSSENLAPHKFAQILNPFDAKWELEKNYLFGKSAGASISEKYHITLNSQSGIGVSSFQEDTYLKRQALDDLMNGTLVAVDDLCSFWSPNRYFMYIDNKGYLQQYGRSLPTNYPIWKLVERYENMVLKYGGRPNPTTIPSHQLATKTTPLQSEEKNLIQKKSDYLSEYKNAQSKQERWKARNNLITRGSRSIYPDARIASERLKVNNIAVERAKLSESIYDVTDPTQPLLNPPEGWKDISNDIQALNKINLRPEDLYDSQKSPGFLARVYSPDKTVFGEEMPTTVALRGTRVLSSKDWANNFSQGINLDSSYYRQAASLGSKLSMSKSPVHITGHSLGGGLASLTSIVSGQPATTFNAAGLNPKTLDHYGAIALGNPDNIQAFRLKGDILTRGQEVNLLDDYEAFGGSTGMQIAGGPGLLLGKEIISSLIPDAIGQKKVIHTDSGSSVGNHMIGKTIESIEQEKEDDIATISHRL